MLTAAQRLTVLQSAARSADIRRAASLLLISERSRRGHNFESNNVISGISKELSAVVDALRSLRHSALHESYVGNESAEDLDQHRPDEQTQANEVELYGEEIFDEDDDEDLMEYAAQNEQKEPLMNEAEYAEALHNSRISSSDMNARRLSSTMSPAEAAQTLHALHCLGALRTETPSATTSADPTNDGKISSSNPSKPNTVALDPAAETIMRKVVEQQQFLNTVDCIALCDIFSDDPSIPLHYPSSSPSRVSIVGSLLVALADRIAAFHCGGLDLREANSVLRAYTRLILMGRPPSSYSFLSSTSSDDDNNVTVTTSEEEGHVYDLLDTILQQITGMLEGAGTASDLAHPGVLLSCLASLSILHQAKGYPKPCASALDESRTQSRPHTFIKAVKAICERLIVVVPYCTLHQCVDTLIAIGHLRPFGLDAAGEVAVGKIAALAPSLPPRTARTLLRTLGPHPLSPAHGQPGSPSPSSSKVKTGDLWMALQRYKATVSLLEREALPALRRRAAS